MNTVPGQKILFIVNALSGNKSTDWQAIITDFFKDKPIDFEILNLDESCSPGLISGNITRLNPGKVFAVGGDGTIKLVAGSLLGSKIPLGILPAGSANGMAKELGIPTDPVKALQLAENGITKKIHLVKINDEICIHLADMGFNAFVIRKFESSAGRGMWGYIKASWKVLWQHAKLVVEIKSGEEVVKRNAAMVVIANATRYGSGALINPEGNLEDDRFELIIVKQVSFSEIYKMMVTHLAYDPAKTEVYQTGYVEIRSKVRAHFQVDGEYLGKVNKIKASIMPGALTMIVPAPTK